MSTSYPYSAGDRVMLGIVTWQHPHAEIPEGPIDSWPRNPHRTPEGPCGPICRYFIAGLVEANDREAGILAVRVDGRVEVLEFGEFGGDEVVPFDETLPRTAADAQARALRGEPTEPVVVCVVCGAPAAYRLTDPTDATPVDGVGAAYCGPCTTSTAAGFTPIH
jgi:hypothetical protein